MADPACHSLVLIVACEHGAANVSLTLSPEPVDLKGYKQVKTLAPAQWDPPQYKGRKLILLILTPSLARGYCWRCARMFCKG